MDAVIENMRNTLGNGVRKMFLSNTLPGRNNTNPQEKNPSEQQALKMSLCNICALEGSAVPFIVRDICKFISEKSIKLEGIFRVSAATRQCNELRLLYESNSDFEKDLLLEQEDMTESTGHAAAGLLKQFFRLLSEPLIHDDVLRIFTDCRSLSDNVFCDKISKCMDSWPAPHQSTLLFLLTFLHTVAQESENRMSVNGLAVVFGPNVFKLPDGIEGLQAQAIANQAFERLLSCSSILSKAAKKQPPPRPPPPQRPLPPTPLDTLVLRSTSPRSLPVTENSGPSKENVPPKNTNVTKPTPVIRKSLSPGNNVMPQNDATPLGANSKTDVILSCGDGENGSISEILQEVFKPDAMPQGNFNVQIGGTQTEATPQTDATSRNSSSEEVPEEISERSDSAEEWKTDSGNNSSELKAEEEESCSILDNSIRRIVQTRLFNSAESSSVSDEAEALRTSGLLPSATAGRNRGPKNRRLPSCPRRLLNNVRLDDSDEDDSAVANTFDVTKATVNMDLSHSDVHVVMTTTNDSVPTSSHVSVFSPAPSGPVSTVASSVTTVTTPDSGCIVEDTDYPRNSSPIKAELSRLDIGQNLSPVHIPKLNLRSSFDEDEMTREEDTTPPPGVDLVPQLDLSSVTESVDREAIKPPKKQVQTIEKAPVRTPPRPAPRQQPATNPGARKKMKKALNLKKKSKVTEVTPQTSDCEVAEDPDETMEQARDKISRVLRENRRVAGRPFDVARMTCEELKDEKLSMQRELLKFESRHGRPTNKEAKQLMREIYDRYRVVKRSLTSGQNTDENENSMKPELDESFLVTQPFANKNSCEDYDVTQEGTVDTPTSDILLSLQELRKKRKRLRRILRDFENERKASEGKLERRVMRSEYEEYRTVKSKLREMEIALAKRGVEIS